MKIVRIIARLNVGGPARHVVWLTKGLQSAGCESLLIAGTVPDGEDDMDYFAAENGIKPIYIPAMSREISPRDLVSIWKLYRLLLRERPDIIHTHTAKAGTLGRVAGLLYRWSSPKVLLGQPRPCQLVHTYHGHIFHSYYGPLKTRFFLGIERSLARLASDRIVVVSRQQLKEINEDFRVGHKDQFVVIPLGLDLTQFASWKDRREQFREELGANREDILVGIVGRLTEIKNHELFLDAVTAFKRMNPTPGRQVRFVVIGDGRLRPRLEQRVQQEGLTADVVFTGTRRDPENFYPALDIVALTSLNEGTPLTLIEAMASGRPVIATAVGGVVDLLGKATSETDDEYAVCERGIAVGPHDPRAFAAGLVRLVTDPYLRDQVSERSLDFVQQNYSKERLLDDIRVLYGELLKPTFGVFAQCSNRPRMPDIVNGQTSTTVEELDRQKGSAVQVR